jgi:hypothetical protein
VHVGTTIGRSYNDTGLAAGSNYSYRVSVRDARGSLNEYLGVTSVDNSFTYNKSFLDDSLSDRNDPPR